MILEKYALPNLIKEYNINKDLIREHFKGVPKEGYRYRISSDNGDVDTILGLSIEIFMLLLIISFALWAIAIYLLVLNWNDLEDWAKVIAILGIIFGVGGPIVTIVIVLVGKKRKSKNGKK